MPTAHKKIQIVSRTRVIRPWGEIKEEASRASEDLGISLARAFRLVLSLDRQELEVL